MKHINTLKNKKGMALLTVMLIFFVLSILLAGLVSVTNSNLKQSVVTKNHTAAFYASEAGITKVSTDFEKKLNELKDQNLSSSAFLSALTSYINTNQEKTINLENNNGETSKAIIALTNEGVDAQGYSNYKLSSKGYVGSLERTLVKTYRFKYTQGTTGNGFKIDKAVMVKSTFALTGSAQIIGAPISTYSKSSSAISMAWSTKVPGIELDPSLFNASGSLINNNIFNSTENINAKIYCEGNTGLKCVKPLKKVYDFPQIVLPTFPSKSTLSKLETYEIKVSEWNKYQLIKDDGSFIKDSWMTNNVTYKFPDGTGWYVPNFTIMGTEVFTIDVGNTDKFLLVDQFHLDGHVKLIGNGTLTIYVLGNTQETASSNESNRISFNFSSSNPVGAVGNSEKFIIYVQPIYQKNNSTISPLAINIGGSAIYHLALMAANLNINVAGSGKINGYVVTGGNSMTVSGGSSTAIALYYAPNAHFELSGGGIINGAVIANSFLASGGTSLTYSDVAFENFPFTILNPITGGSGSTATLELTKSSTIEQ